MKLYTYQTYLKRTLHSEVSETVSAYCKNSYNAYELLCQLGLDSAPEERFVALCLNVKNQFVGMTTVSVGGLAGTSAAPREVFRTAILCNANAIILGHNHPSGGTNPSQEDIDLTNRLIKAGELLGIRVLDHIIVGTQTGKYLSLRESNIAFI